MGREGVYYRKTLSNKKNKPQEKANESIDNTPMRTEIHSGMREIESGSVAEMTDSSSEGLLKELNEKNQKIKKWPWVAFISFIAIGQIYKLNLLEWQLSAISWAILLLIIWTYYYDKVSKSTVLMYEFRHARALFYCLSHFQ